MKRLLFRTFVPMFRFDIPNVHLRLTSEGDEEIVSLVFANAGVSLSTKPGGTDGKWLISLDYHPPSVSLTSTSLLSCLQHKDGSNDANSKTGKRKSLNQIRALHNVNPDEVADVGRLSPFVMNILVSLDPSARGPIDPNSEAGAATHRSSRSGRDPGFSRLASSKMKRHSSSDIFNTPRQGKTQATNRLAIGSEVTLRSLIANSEVSMEWGGVVLSLRESHIARMVCLINGFAPSGRTSTARPTTATSSSSSSENGGGPSQGDISDGVVASFGRRLLCPSVVRFHMKQIAINFALESPKQSGNTESAKVNRTSQSGVTSTSTSSGEIERKSSLSPSLFDDVDTEPWSERAQLQKYHSMTLKIEDTSVVVTPLDEDSVRVVPDGHPSLLGTDLWENDPGSPDSSFSDIYDKGPGYNSDESADNGDSSDDSEEKRRPSHGINTLEKATDSAPNPLSWTGSEPVAGIDVRLDSQRISVVHSSSPFRLSPSTDEREKAGGVDAEFDTDPTDASNSDEITILSIHPVRLIAVIVDNSLVFDVPSLASFVSREAEMCIAEVALPPMLHLLRVVLESKRMRRNPFEEYDNTKKPVELSVYPLFWDVDVSVERTRASITRLAIDALDSGSVYGSDSEDSENKGGRDSLGSPVAPTSSELVFCCEVRDASFSWTVRGTDEDDLSAQGRSQGLPVLWKRYMSVMVGSVCLSMEDILSTPHFNHRSHYVPLQGWVAWSTGFHVNGVVASRCHGGIVALTDHRFPVTGSSRTPGPTKTRPKKQRRSFSVYHTRGDEAVVEEEKVSLIENQEKRTSRSSFMLPQTVEHLHLQQKRHSRYISIRPSQDMSYEIKEDSSILLGLDLNVDIRLDCVGVEANDMAVAAILQTHEAFFPALQAVHRTFEELGADRFVLHSHQLAAASAVRRSFGFDSTLSVDRFDIVVDFEVLDKTRHLQWIHAAGVHLQGFRECQYEEEGGQGILTNSRTSSFDIEVENVIVSGAEQSSGQKPPLSSELEEDEKKTEENDFKQQLPFSQTPLELEDFPHNTVACLSKLHAVLQIVQPHPNPGTNIGSSLGSVSSSSTSSRGSPSTSPSTVYVCGTSAKTVDIFWDFSQHMILESLALFVKHHIEKISAVRDDIKRQMLAHSVSSRTASPVARVSNMASKKSRRDGDGVGSSGFGLNSSGDGCGKEQQGKKPPYANDDEAVVSSSFVFRPEFLNIRADFGSELHNGVSEDGPRLLFAVVGSVFDAASRTLTTEDGDLSINDSRVLCWDNVTVSWRHHGNDDKGGSTYKAPKELLLEWLRVEFGMILLNLDNDMLLGDHIELMLLRWKAYKGWKRSAVPTSLYSSSSSPTTPPSSFSPSDMNDVGGGIRSSVGGGAPSDDSPPTEFEFGGLELAAKHLRFRIEDSSLDIAVALRRWLSMDQSSRDRENMRRRTYSFSWIPPASKHRRGNSTVLNEVTPSDVLLQRVFLPADQTIRTEELNLRRRMSQELSAAPFKSKTTVLEEVEVEGEPLASSTYRPHRRLSSHFESPFSALKQSNISESKEEMAEAEEKRREKQRAEQSNQSRPRTRNIKETLERERQRLSTLCVMDGNNVQISLSRRDLEASVPSTSSNTKSEGSPKTDNVPRPRKRQVMFEPKVDQRAMVEELARLDPCPPEEAPYMQHGLSVFSTLWGRELSLSASQVSFRLRDYPMPLLSCRNVTVSGLLIYCQLKCPPPFQTTRTISLPLVGASSAYQVELPSNLSLPWKLFHDLSLAFEQPTLTYGVCFHPALLATAEGLARLSSSRSAEHGTHQGSTRSARKKPVASIGLSWWDVLRYKVHGRLGVESRNFVVRALSTACPYQTSCVEVQMKKVSYTATQGVFLSDASGCSASIVDIPDAASSSAHLRRGRGAHSRGVSAQYTEKNVGQAFDQLRDTNNTANNTAAPNKKFTFDATSDEDGNQILYPNWNGSLLFVPRVRLRLDINFRCNSAMPTVHYVHHWYCDRYGLMELLSPEPQARKQLMSPCPSSPQSLHIPSPQRSRKKRPTSGGSSKSGGRGEDAVSGCVSGGLEGEKQVSDPTRGVSIPKLKITKFRVPALNLKPRELFDPYLVDVYEGFRATDLRLTVKIVMKPQSEAAAAAAQTSSTPVPTAAKEEDEASAQAPGVSTRSRPRVRTEREQADVADVEIEDVSDGNSDDEKDDVPVPPTAASTSRRDSKRPKRGSGHSGGDSTKGGHKRAIVGPYFVLRYEAIDWLWSMFCLYAYPPASLMSNNNKLKNLLDSNSPKPHLEEEEENKKNGQSSSFITLLSSWKFEVTCKNPCLEFLYHCEEKGVIGLRVNATMWGYDTELKAKMIEIDDLSMAPPQSSPNHGKKKKKSRTASMGTGNEHLSPTYSPPVEDNDALDFEVPTSPTVNSTRVWEWANTASDVLKIRAKVLVPDPNFGPRRSTMPSSTRMNSASDLDSASVGSPMSLLHRRGKSDSLMGLGLNIGDASVQDNSSSNLLDEIDENSINNFMDVNGSFISPFYHSMDGKKPDFFLSAKFFTYRSSTKLLDRGIGVEDIRNNAKVHFERRDEATNDGAFEIQEDVPKPPFEMMMRMPSTTIAKRWNLVFPELMKPSANRRNSDMELMGQHQRQFSSIAGMSVDGDKYNHLDTSFGGSSRFGHTDEESIDGGDGKKEKKTDGLSIFINSVGDEYAVPAAIGGSDNRPRSPSVAESFESVSPMASRGGSPVSMSELSSMSSEMMMEDPNETAGSLALKIDTALYGDEYDIGSPPGDRKLSMNMLQLAEEKKAGYNDGDVSPWEDDERERRGDRRKGGVSSRLDVWRSNRMNINDNSQPLGLIALSPRAPANGGARRFGNDRPVALSFRGSGASSRSGALSPHSFASSAPASPRSPSSPPRRPATPLSPLSTQSKTSQAAEEGPTGAMRMMFADMKMVWTQSMRRNVKELWRLWWYGPIQDRRLKEVQKKEKEVEEAERLQREELEDMDIPFEPNPFLVALQKEQRKEQERLAALEKAMEENPSNLNTSSHDSSGSTVSTSASSPSTLHSSFSTPSAMTEEGSKRRTNLSIVGEEPESTSTETGAEAENRSSAMRSVSQPTIVPASEEMLMLLEEASDTDSEGDKTGDDGVVEESKEGGSPVAEGNIPTSASDENQPGSHSTADNNNSRSTGAGGPPNFTRARSNDSSIGGGHGGSGGNADVEPKMRLFVLDFLRPQVSFQSEKTDCRLVLTAARARSEGLGYPFLYDISIENEVAGDGAAGGSRHSSRGSERPNSKKKSRRSSSFQFSPRHVQHHRSNSSSTTSHLSARNELSSVHDPGLFAMHYHKKEVCATLIDASIFVAPLDIDVGSRLTWVPEKVFQYDDAVGETLAALKMKRANMSFDSEDLAAMHKVEYMRNAGILRRIVNPGLVFWTYSYDTDLSSLVDRLSSVCGSVLQPFDFAMGASSPSVQPVSSNSPTSMSSHSFSPRARADSNQSSGSDKPDDLPPASPEKNAPSHHRDKSALDSIKKRQERILKARQRALVGLLRHALHSKKSAARPNESILQDTTTEVRSQAPTRRMSVTAASPAQGRGRRFSITSLAQQPPSDPSKVPTPGLGSARGAPFSPPLGVSGEASHRSVGGGKSPAASPRKFTGSLPNALSTVVGNSRVSIVDTTPFMLNSYGGEVDEMGVLCSARAKGHLNSISNPSSQHVSVKQLEFDKMLKVKDRVPTTAIKVFLPRLDTSMDGREFRTLIYVITYLLMADIDVAIDDRIPAPPADEEDYINLVEEVLQRINSRRQSTLDQKVVYTVDYSIGSMDWNLKSSDTLEEFMQTKIDRFHGHHRWKRDKSMTTLFNCHRIGCTSLVEESFYKELLMNNPGHVLSENNDMIHARAEITAPAGRRHPRLSCVTLYEHLEVSTAPMVVQLPHDHISLLTRYFIPDIAEEDDLGDFDEEQKEDEKAKLLWTGKKTVKKEKRRSQKLANLKADRDSSDLLPYDSSGMSSAVSSVTLSQDLTPGSSTPQASPKASRRGTAPLRSPSRRALKTAVEDEEVARMQLIRGGSMRHLKSADKSNPSGGRPQMAVITRQSSIRDFMKASPAAGADELTNWVMDEDLDEELELVQKSSVQHFNYFKYIRIGDITFRVSYNGGLLNIKDIKLDIRSFVYSRKMWAWNEFVSRISRHVAKQVLWQSKQVLFGAKKDDTGANPITKILGLFKKKMKKKNKNADEPAGGNGASITVIDDPDTAQVEEEQLDTAKASLLFGRKA